MSSATEATIESIRQLIDAELNPGDRLPSEPELGEQLGVSRTTVRDALARLSVGGVVEKRWGIGTFVAEPKPPTAYDLMAVDSGIPGLLASTGGTPSIHRFEATEEPPDPDAFPNFPESPVIALVRVFALDGVPAVALRDRIVGEFAEGRFNPEPLRSIDAHVHDLLRRTGIDFQSLQLQLWADTLDVEDRALFELAKSEAVIKTHGWGLDADARRILTVRAIYRTSVIRIGLST